MLLHRYVALWALTGAAALLWASCGCQVHVPGGATAPEASPEAASPAASATPPPAQLTSEGRTGEATPLLAVEDTRPIAAALLGCDPASLQLADRQPEPRAYAWGTIREVEWRAAPSGPMAPLERADVRVDRVSHYVTTASLRRAPDHARIPPPEVARKAATQFFGDRAKLPVQSAQLTVKSLPMELSVSAEGVLADGRRYFARLSFTDGAEPTRYEGHTLPPAPTPTPVRITAEDACRIARQYATNVRKLDVVRARVESLFDANGVEAPPGVWVYNVEVTARYPMTKPTGPKMCEYVSVNSVTGEVIERHNR